jgi:hypothetical protein
MTIKLIPLLVLVLGSSGLFSAAAEVTANSDYAAAEKAAKEAEVAVAPAKTAAEQAAAEQRSAEQAAAAKRQQANEAKKKADDLIGNLQKPAEANLSAAIKAVTDATNAKAATDKALADAKAAALPWGQKLELFNTQGFIEVDEGLMKDLSRAPLWPDELETNARICHRFGG